MCGSFDSFNYLPARRQFLQHCPNGRFNLDKFAVDKENDRASRLKRPLLRSSKSFYREVGNLVFL